MSARDTVFQSIRQALEPLDQRTPYPEWESQAAVSAVARGPENDLPLFVQRLEAAKGVYLKDWSAVAAFLDEHKARCGFLDAGLDEGKAALSGWDLHTTVDRERIDDLAFGITWASGAIAESGTLIFRDGDTPYRLAALAPWIHIAVVRRESLVRTIPEAVERMGPDPSIVWATGPSKTADIEGILIEGVHGPGIQACIVV